MRKIVWEWFKAYLYFLPYSLILGPTHFMNVTHLGEFFLSLAKSNRELVLQAEVKSTVYLLTFITTAFLIDVSLRFFKSKKKSIGLKRFLKITSSVILIHTGATLILGIDYTVIYLLSDMILVLVGLIVVLVEQYEKGEVEQESEKVT